MDVNTQVLPVLDTDRDGEVQYDEFEKLITASPNASANAPILTADQYLKDTKNKNGNAKKAVKINDVEKVLTKKLSIQTSF